MDTTSYIPAAQLHSLWSQVSAANLRSAEARIPNPIFPQLRQDAVKHASRAFLEALT